MGDSDKNAPGKPFKRDGAETPPSTGPVTDLSAPGAPEVKPAAPAVEEIVSIRRRPAEEPRVFVHEPCGAEITITFRQGRDLQTGKAIAVRCPKCERIVLPTELKPAGASEGDTSPTTTQPES